MADRIISLAAYDDPDGKSSSCSASSSSTCSQDAKAIRANLVSKGIERPILSVLDTTFTITYQNFTLLETMLPDNANVFKSADGRQPGYVVAQTLESALARYQLTLQQKRELFGILGWQFECLSCKKRKRAVAFENSSFILWGKNDPVRVHLRSGPCTVCKAEARNKNGGGIVPYTVKSP